MGNLPTARTETCIAGASVSHNLMNELQDMIVGAKFPQMSLYVSGADFAIDGGAPTRSENVWTFAAASTQKLVYPFRLIPGIRLVDAVWSYNRTSSTLLLEIKRRSFGDGGATSSTPSTVTVSAGTGWTTVAQSTGGGLPLVTADAFYYLLSITSTSVALFDGVKLTFDRL